MGERAVGAVLSQGNNQAAMKRVIYKYSIKPLASLVDVQMPFGAHILTAQMQGDVLCLWAMVNPEAVTVSRHIEIIGTGNPFTESHRRHIATVQDGPWVWHVFDRLL